MMVKMDVTTAESGWCQLFKKIGKKNCFVVESREAKQCFLI